MQTEEWIQTAPGGKLRILNRDVIKYIAMLTMLLNHIAHIFLVHRTPLYNAFEDIGYFTAPVMCFFLVEGYQHTRSKWKYGLRLFLFAVLSQIPFYLAFDYGYGSLNMLYTLFCCFLILAVMEKVSSPSLKMSLGALLMLCTIVGDWAILAPLCTILFAGSWGDRRKMAVNYGVLYIFFVVLNVQSYMDGPGNWTFYAVYHAMLAGLGILAAAMATLVLYNGERAKYGQNFSKWFFYMFYPAHLLVLYLIKISLHNI